MFSADTAIITWKVFLYLTQREHEKCFQGGSERNIVEYTVYVPCRYSLDTCKIFSWYFFYIHIKNIQRIYTSEVLKQVSEAVFLWETQVSLSSVSFYIRKFILCHHKHWMQTWTWRSKGHLTGHNGGTGTGAPGWDILGGAWEACRTQTKGKEGM